MSPTEKLRRAVADAERAAATAHTAAWRARRKMDVVREAVSTLGSIGAPLRAFADAETARLLEQAREVELAAYAADRETSDLAEFMGARARR